MPMLPQAIHYVQIDVGEQRTDHAALRRPYRGGLPFSFFHNSRREPLTDELKHPSVADAALHKAEQLFMVDGVEEALDVRIHPPPPQDQRGFPRLHRLSRTPPRAESEGAVPETGFKHWLHDKPARLLDHAVTNRGNPQRTLPTIRLRNVHPHHWLRAIHLLLQVLCKLVEEALNA